MTHTVDDSDATLRAKIEEFRQTLPYRNGPYVSRAWGHPLHSLCSYQGKLKPSLAHWLVQQFTKPGDLVVDPLAGVGTIPFAAGLLGRRNIANDLSPFAATIARAKVDPPSLDEAEVALGRLSEAMDRVSLNDADRESARFGLNATVADYYHPETLDEVLRARSVFRTGDLNGRGSVFVWASLLHVLHGNRPYALSRTSHPITPFSPTGPFEYKSLIGKTRGRLQRALATPLPVEFVPGRGIFGDFRELDHEQSVGGTEIADAIITSPPFLGMRFDRPNWLRMWFCGWNAIDFHETSLSFLERQQTKSLNCYVEFFEACSKLLRHDGLLIVHVGSGKRDRLVDGIRESAQGEFRGLGEIVEDVAALEKHGLVDKGARTTNHHLLYFRRR